MDSLVVLRVMYQVVIFESDSIRAKVCIEYIENRVCDYQSALGKR